MSDNVHFGKRLRRRRRLMGLTQKAVANHLKVRFQQIQKYESGANKISASRLGQLAEVLEVPVQYFYDGLNEEPTETERELTLSERADSVALLEAFHQLEPHQRERYLKLVRAATALPNESLKVAA